MTLAKISRAEFGYGGYHDVQFGVTWTFSFNGGGVGDFWGQWADDPSPDARWSVDSRAAEWDKMLRRLRDVLKAAKREHVSELVGTPVELAFDGAGGAGSRLVSWRVLTEVL